MADRTPKEDFLALLNGELPQSIPYYGMGAKINGREPVRSLPINIFNTRHRGPQGGKDIWGINYVANAETNFAALPEPNNFILKDITKWRDIVKPPEVPNVDWEAIVRTGIEKAEIDRNTSALMVNGAFQPFQLLVAFMGFTEALCAMYEEPEEVKSMLNFITDFYMPIIEKTIEYTNPDIFYMGDDTASKYNPFFSVEMYRDIFKPIYQRIAKPANERGIPIGFHNCGRCEDFVDDMYDFGVRVWDPCQKINDLLAIRKKYGRKIVFCGAWEAALLPGWPDNTSEEVIRQSIRDSIDTYGADGGYCFAGGVLGRAGDEEAKRLQDIVREEAMTYGKNYYERNHIV